MTLRENIEQEPAMPEPEYKEFIIQRINTLLVLAEKYETTVEISIELNPEIRNSNMIFERQII